jgi:exonuclease III
MKIVSWNMNQYGRWSEPDLAWDYLVNEIQPDIALLQETLVPKRYENDVIFLESYTDIKPPRWGTAIFVNRKTMPEFDVHASKEKTKELLGELYDLGKTAITELVLKDGISYIFASLHIDTGRYGRIPVLTDWPEVDHLKAILENSKLGLLSGNYIIGGDLNADPVAYPEHKHSFDWLRNHGFHECLRGQPNTYFGYKRKATIQDDHIFVHESMANKIVFCHPLEYRSIKHFSDHTIIEMEIDI